MDKPPIGNILRTRIQPFRKVETIPELWGGQRIVFGEEGGAQPELVLDYFRAPGIPDGYTVAMPILQLHRDRATIRRPTRDGVIATATVEVHRRGNSVVCTVTDSEGDGEIEETTSLLHWDQGLVQRWLEG